MENKLTLDIADKIFEKEYENMFGLNSYEKIQKNIEPLDSEFQKEFIAFYKLRGLNKEKLKGFFELFNELKDKRDVTYDYILDSLLMITGRVEASFASKMLATLNSDKPIIDQFVLKFLEKEITGDNSKEKIESAKRIYSEVEDWYETFKNSAEGKKCIDFFDKKFPKYTTVSNVKKIDCFLWGSGLLETLDNI